ncbi:MAG: RluA family pseudouridine synthase [Lentisphaerae bacterium]|jgi:RluA family pseudouridine synthase|nr:RluA family pseudouridine synthase [Lentisphaerota bacterium]
MARHPTPPQRASLRRLPPVRRNGTPLLDHLAETLSLSRRAAKALLDERVVLVNGRRVWMARHLLQIRDIVEVPHAPPAKTAPAKQPLHVLLDDPHFVVADKPPRLLSTGADSLETRLRQQLNLPDLRAVHRLDRDTSGCLLLAKTETARQDLIAQFADNQVRKIYHALVAGHLPETEMEVRAKINQQSALSHFRQVSAQPRPPRCAHVIASIDTGRTHQIRIHLQRVGCPILGDRQYFSASSAAFPDVPRQMLHAASLRFPHPRTGQAVAVASPLPRDFRDWMRNLRLK